MVTIRNMNRAILLFGTATLTPAALLAAGATWGGLWIIAAVLYLTAMPNLLDRVLTRESTTIETTGGDGLAILVAAVHFMLMPLMVWALVGETLGLPEKIGLFLAAGLWFGQVGNANAHELIHRPSRGLHRLGMWVYITLLFGHHTSAHVLVHHVHVGTASDPNTSRKGENLYRYMRRAWIGSFLQGYRAEHARLQKINRPAWRNPYALYVGGAALCLLLAFIWGGVAALLTYLALCAHAQSQLLMSDYVQHYGLTRRIAPNGKVEPVGARHSWNSPHWFSSAMMLNAPRHSDHHARPAQPYPALTIPQDAPMLPRPLPLMASIALIPPLWRRIMDPRVERWQDA